MTYSKLMTKVMFSQRSRRQGWFLPWFPACCKRKHVEIDRISWWLTENINDRLGASYRVVFPAKLKQITGLNGICSISGSFFSHAFREFVNRGKGWNSDHSDCWTDWTLHSKIVIELLYHVHKQWCDGFVPATKNSRRNVHFLLADSFKLRVTNGRSWDLRFIRYRCYMLSAWEYHLNLYF